MVGFGETKREQTTEEDTERHDMHNFGNSIYSVIYHFVFPFSTFPRQQPSVDI